MKFTSILTRQLLDLAPDATVIVDSRGQIVFANARTRTVLGYEPEEIIGRQMDLLLPERFRAHHPVFRQTFFEGPRSRPMGQGLDLWALRKDGAEIPVEISLSPVDTGEETIVCASIRDITDRYGIQEQLKAAKLAAERANRAKSSFLAAASHDLRQPLQTLNMLNGILKRLVNSPRVLKIIDDQAEALNSISEMLNSLLDISKLEAGVVIPDVYDHSVQQIFQRLRRQFAATAEIKGIEFIIEDCDETIHSDEGLLMQILSNLVSNAIRYTNEGRVKIRCVHGQSHVTIQVLDTGIGIPPDQMNAIFEEFYQIDPGQKHHEGFGLGLAVVRRLVDLLGHRLELDSHPGQGSCFSVFVPAGGPADQSAGPSPFAGAVPSPQKMVLLVDDSLPVLDATRTLLEIEGYTVLSATSGRQAVDLVINKGYMPDVIICDFHIPGAENGIALIKELNQHAGKNIPSVLATGDTSRAVKNIIKTVDNCYLLNKPIAIDLLLDTLSSRINSLN